MDADELRKLAAVEDRHWWYAERRSILGRLLRQHAARGPGVDIGAAGGGNTRVLANAGIQAVALEPNPVAASIAHERGVSALIGDARRAPLRDSSVGVVVAFDVLEHIPEDDVAVAELARILVPGGLLFVAVPADPTLWSGHDDAVGHVRRYTRGGLSSLVSAAPFEVLRIWSWNVLMRPGLMLRRRGQEGSDLDDPRPVVNRVLRSVVAAERFLPVGRLPGVSLMLVARRTPS